MVVEIGCLVWWIQQKCIDNPLQRHPCSNVLLTDETFVLKVVKVLVGVEVVAVPTGPGRQPGHVARHPDGVVARRAADERRLPQAPDRSGKRDDEWVRIIISVSLTDFSWHCSLDDTLTLTAASPGLKAKPGMRVNTLTFSGHRSLRMLSTEERRRKIHMMRNVVDGRVHLLLGCVSPHSVHATLHSAT